MRLRYLPIGAVLVLLTALVVTAVQAQEVPRQPLRLFGTVTSAVPNGAVVATTPDASCVKGVPIVAGQYGSFPDLLNFPQDNPATTPIEGAAPGKVVSVFVDPDQPATTTFPTGGGIQRLDVSASTTQGLSASLAVSGAAQGFTASGAVTDQSSGAAVSGAQVNVNWGDGTACSQTTSGGTGGYSASHTYATAGSFTVTTVVYKPGATADLSTGTVTVVAGTPAASPTATPTTGGGPAATATPAPSFGGGGGAFIPPDPTPTTVPTPTPVTAEGLGDLDTADAAEVIGGLSTEDAADILDSLEADSAADILNDLDSATAADILGELTADKAADIVEKLSGDRAAGLLEAVTTEKAADALERLDTDRAATIIDSLAADSAADIIEAMGTAKATDILTRVDTAKAAGIIGQVETAKAASFVGELATARAAAIIEQVDTTKAANIIEQVETGKAADILEQVDTGKAADIVGAVGIAKASDILSEVTPRSAGAILEEVATDRVTGFVRVMDEDKLIERLPEMSPGKLFELPIDVLIRELPSVPVEAISREVVPEAVGDLPGRVLTTPTLAVYEITDSLPEAWAVLVGSPIPIKKILGKYQTATAGVRVTVESMPGLPEGSPEFLAGQVVHSLFSIGVENVQPEDLIAAHITVFVEKSWLEENQVHKWSIQVNRFDPERGSWVRHQAKRIREDEDSVFYSVVVPGFSDIAITGSSELPKTVFQVTDLVIAPVSPSAGEELAVSATVTNTGSIRAVYPASLWIDDMIEAARAVEVGPGQSVSFQLTFRRPEGEYRVRLERLLGSVRVLSARVATATPTPEAAPAPGTDAPPVAEPTATQTPTPTATPAAAPPIPPRATQTPAPTRTPVSVRAATPTATPPPPAAAVASLAPSPTSVPAAVTRPAPTPTGPPVPPPALQPVAPGERRGIGVGVGVVLGIIATIVVAGAGAAIYLGGRGLSPSLPEEGIQTGDDGTDDLVREVFADEKAEDVPNDDGGGPAPEEPDGDEDAPGRV